jgi:hypothetical protein
MRKIRDAKGKAFKVTSVDDVKVILDALEVPFHDDSLGIFGQEVGGG